MSMMKEKKKGKLLSYLMWFMLIFTIMSVNFITAFKVNKVYAAWEGEGIGTKESPYQIGTASQLKKFRDIVNGINGEKQNVYACAKLTANINLEGSEDDQWVPIGTFDRGTYLTYENNEIGYLGVFEGNGYTISGLYFNDNNTDWNYNGNDYIGLFGAVGRSNDVEGGIVRNLTVEGSFTAGDYVGGIAGVLYGSVENCVNKVTINAESNVGGIAGTAYHGSIIRRSTNQGTLSINNSYLGGIVGYVRGYYDDETKLTIPSLVVNCVNKGDLNTSSFTRIGGIAGQVYGYTSVIYCHNVGTITINYQRTYEPSDPAVGGIVGYVTGVNDKWSFESEQALVENCYNAGNITSNTNYAICGIVARADCNALIRYCINYGTLSITATATNKKTYGGVLATSSYSGNNATVKNLYYLEGSAVNDGNATKKNGTQLKDKETFRDTSSYAVEYYLDFDYCWEIGENGAILRDADSLDVAYVMSTISVFLTRNYYDFYNDGAMIYKAKKAYLLLSDAQRATIPEQYVEKLDEAVSVYAVLEKIHSVGKVYYSSEVKERIDVAMDAYNELSAERKQLLSKNEVLDLYFYKQQYENAVVLYNYLGQQGIGSDENPFLISTKEQLFRINDVISASYKLVNDIDAECSKENQWIPIGTYQGEANDDISRWSPYYDVTDCRAFTGVLDGDGHTISNLYIDVFDKYESQPNYYEQYAAFMYFLGDGGKIKNLTLEGSFRAKCYVGSFVYLNSGIIENCVNKATISGSSELGGISSINYGQILNCKNEASITGATEDDTNHVNCYCGGISGHVGDGAIISNCTNNGDVTGRTSIGGIVGYCGGGKVWNSTNNGNVTGYQKTGGIVGLLLSRTDWFDFPVEVCYNAGTISGTSDYTGGIVGYIERPYGNETGIENTYNIGNIIGTNYVGGLVGYSPYSSKIRVSHNVGSVSGTGSNVGQLAGYVENSSDVYISYYRSDTDQGANVLTTEQFKDIYNFGGNTGYWKNGEIWMPGDEYPIFISPEMIRAREVSTYIGNIGSISYTPGSKEKIDAAKEAYDNLTEEEKALIPQSTREALEKAIEDYNAVDGAVILIDVIGEVKYPDSKDAIDAAKQAVSNLTNDQKDILGDKENDLKQAEVDYAKGAIDAIGDVTYPGSKDKIDAAKAAVADLDNNQLALVTNLGDLEKAEKLYDAMDKIADIGEVSYPGSKDKIDVAKAAVAALDNNQLALVTNLGDLENAEIEFAKGAIDAIGVVTYPDSKDAIDAARGLIDDLDNNQLALVTNLGDLEDAEKLYDVMGKIADIGEVSYPGSKDKIDAAKAAVAALDENQLALVTNLADLDKAEANYAKGAIDAIGEVSFPDSKDAIEAAKSVIAELDEDQLALVTNLADLEEKEIDFIEAAIDAIGEEVYPGGKDAIEAAKAIVAGLDEDQLALISNLDKLNNAEVEYAKGAINAIGDVTYPDSKDAIVAAREAYDAVDDNKKQYVDNYDKLVAAEEKFVLNVKTLIDAVGVFEYSEQFEDRLNAASNAYNDLSEHLKSLVNNAENLQQLSDDYFGIKEAASAIFAIDHITYGDADTIQWLGNARTLVDTLSDSKKQLFPEAILKILVDDEKAYEAMGKIKAMILPLENTFDCLDKVNDAEAFFNTLTEDQKDIVGHSMTSTLNSAVIAKNAVEAVNAIDEVEYTQECKNKLDYARELIDPIVSNPKLSSLLPEDVVKELIDKGAAYATLGKILAIGIPEDTLAFRDRVNEARQSYNNLTEKQKEYVKESYTNDLENKEAIIKVIDEINKIGEVTYTIECKNKIDYAREMYNSLTEEEKAIFPTDVLKILEDDEKLYNAMDKINAIGEVEYTAESKEKIDIAMEAFESLDSEQKEFVSNRMKLQEAQETYSVLENQAKANRVRELIAAIGEVNHPDSKEKIQEARLAYDDLSEKQKELVDNYQVLIDAEKAYTAIEKINSIGNLENTKECKNKIAEARSCYNNLTSEQKNQVPSPFEQGLEDYEYALVVLEQIYGIGEVKYTTESENAIKEATKAYDSLTKSQKALISRNDLELLTFSEETYNHTKSTANTWFIILLILAIITLGAGAYVLFLLLRKNNNKTLKTLSVVPFFPILTSHLADAKFIILYILLALAAIVWVANLVLFLLNKKNKDQKIEQPKPTKQEIQKEPIKEEKQDIKLEEKQEVKSLENEESDDEEEVMTITDENGNIFNIRYNKSFTAKLIQSPDKTKKYYEELKNYTLSYKKTSSRISWSHDSINNGRNKVLKFAIRGKTLCVYLPLNADDYLDTKYKVEKSETKKYEEVSCLYRIKNDRRLEYAKELIDLVMTKFNVVKGKEVNEDYYIPYEETKVLLKKGLIKLVKRKINQAEELLHSVDVLQADKLMSDEKAEIAIEEDVIHHSRNGKKEIINIDTLSKHYNDGDEVTLDSLIEKKLLPAKTGKVKVLARGTLDKCLTIYLDDFSLQAVKMIVLLGGHAKKIK